MFHLNPTSCLILVAALVLPNLSQSEPVTLGYFARVEPVMISPENSLFECYENERPAQIELSESTFGVASANFPPTLLDPPMPPQVILRRGTERVPERVENTSNSFIKDWHVIVTGTIDICVGTASLRAVQGGLDVFARLGKHEGQILSSDDLLQPQFFKYEAYVQGMSLVDFFRAPRDGFPSEMNAQFVGKLPANDREDARIWGRLDGDASELAIRFSAPNKVEDIIHLTRLNIRLILQSSALDFPNPKVDEHAKDSG